VNAERAVEMAEEALSANRPDFASELRVAVALRAGASDRARVLYPACARHATKRPAEILSPQFGENGSEDISAAMEVPAEQLQHCRTKLRESEGSE
jgi:hypothetical protein